MHMRLRTKYPYSCKILIKVKFSRQIFEKSYNNTFHKKKKLCIGGSICSMRTERRADWQTHDEIWAAFRNFAKASKKQAFNKVTVSWIKQAADWQWIQSEQGRQLFYSALLRKCWASNGWTAQHATIRSCHTQKVVRPKQTQTKDNAPTLQFNYTVLHCATLRKFSLWPQNYCVRIILTI